MKNSDLIVYGGLGVLAIYVISKSWKGIKDTAEGAAGIIKGSASIVGGTTEGFGTDLKSLGEFVQQVGSITPRITGIEPFLTMRGFKDPLLKTDYYDVIGGTSPLGLGAGGVSIDFLGPSVRAANRLMTKSVSPSHAEFLKQDIYSFVEKVESANPTKTISDLKAKGEEVLQFATTKGSSSGGSSSAVSGSSSSGGSAKAAVLTKTPTAQNQTLVSLANNVTNPINTTPTAPKESVLTKAKNFLGGLFRR